MATQLTLAVIGLLIPAAFYYTLSSSGAAHRNGLEEQVSVAVALLLILSYGLGLLFSLRTHSHLYTPEDEEAMHGGAWSVRRSLAVLLLATAGAALMSEILVRSLEDAAHVLGWSEVFVGVIIVPIIGNAAEHLTAVTVAWKDKMDLSLSIALGSSIQIALLVAPLLVLLSFAFSHHMNLLWDSFELVAITLAVLIARFVAEDGESTRVHSC
jgi:Ca2+:H+ antiporter